MMNETMILNGTCDSQSESMASWLSLAEHNCRESRMKKINTNILANGSTVMASWKVNTSTCQHLHTDSSPSPFGPFPFPFTLHMEGE